MCKAVISLDEMHETYEKVLSEEEERLQKIYEAAVAGSDVVELEEEEEKEVVVALLKDSEANKTIERVNLSGRKLNLLPDAFGKIKSLLVLDLSNNQLVVIFILLLCFAHLKASIVY